MHIIEWKTEKLQGKAQLSKLIQQVFWFIWGTDVRQYFAFQSTIKIVKTLLIQRKIFVKLILMEIVSKIDKEVKIEEKENEQHTKMEN